jgi:DNA-binding LacI/PurR family transcriptional regulator
LEFDPSNVVEISLAEALVEKPNARLNSLKKVFTRFEQGVRTWVCACEILGLSLREGALERALQIPEDIMITGFHADTQHYQHGGHTLTSTLSNSEELGGAALRRLINRIENPREMRRTILLPCGFVQGKSTRQYGAEGDRVASCSALIPAKYPNYTRQDGV